MPFLLAHLATALLGNGKLYEALPANDPVEVWWLTVVGVNRAATARWLPFHEMLSVNSADVALRVTQEIGLREKLPFAVPLVMLTVLTLVEQPDNCARTEEGLVPPPEDVRGGEIATLAETAQLTEPGADTVLDVAADAGPTGIPSPMAATSPVASATHVRPGTRCLSPEHDGSFTEPPSTSTRHVVPGTKSSVFQRELARRDSKRW